RARAPGCGARCAARASPRRRSLALLDLDHVAHGVQHAARWLRVLEVNRVSNSAQAERAQGRQLFGVGAVARAALGHAQRAHQPGASPAAAALSLAVAACAGGTDAGASSSAGSAWAAVPPSGG